MSEHLTDAAPLSLHLRMALHDWMWRGGARPRLDRRLARRLPLYFSDPEAHELRSQSLEWAEVTLPAAVEVWPSWSGTATTSGSGTFTYTWPPSSDNPHA